MSAQRRFTRAAADIAALASGEDAAVVEQLATAPIRALGRIVHSSNAVFLLELDAPDPHVAGRPMRAIYKPTRGERPLHDFTRNTLHLRERAAYLVSAAAAMGVVPPTALRDGPQGPGSVQLYVHPREEPLPETAAPALEAQLHRIAVFDVLANNADRKRAHLLVDGTGHLWGIDNALTFLPYPRQRTVLLDLGGNDLDRDDAESGTTAPGWRLPRRPPQRAATVAERRRGRRVRGTVGGAGRPPVVPATGRLGRPALRVVVAG